MSAAKTLLFIVGMCIEHMHGFILLLIIKKKEMSLIHLSLHENVIHSSGVLNLLVPMNIFNGLKIDEYKLIFIGFDWAPTNI
jgi:hypothetical protein